MSKLQGGSDPAKCARYGALVGFTGLAAYAETFEVSWLANFGVLSHAEEARVHQLCFSVMLAACVTWFAIVQMGVEDPASKWLAATGRALAPVAACAAFMVVGPSLMVLNKHIMEVHGFRYPITLSGLGLVGACAFSRLAVASGAAQLRRESVEAVAGANYWRIVFPISACRAVTLATGNAVYLHLSLGFIQMLKAFTPAIMLVVMVFAQVDRPARAAIWCVMVIVCGTLVEVEGEMQATLVGLLLMMTSCIGEAISTVLSQKLMHNFKFNEIEAMYYLSPPSVVALGAAAAVLEGQEFISAGGYLLFVQRPALMLTAALLGVGVNLLTLIVVRATSSVTVKILNTLRCIGLVIVGVIFYDETRSPKQCFGYAVSLVGFIGYNFFQLRADAAAAVEVRADALARRLAAALGLAALAGGRAGGGRSPAAAAGGQAPGGSPRSPTRPSDRYLLRADMLD